MTATVQALVNQPYKYGFVTSIESDTIPRGLSEDVVRMISAKKNEPEYMLEFRLKAYRQWLKMQEPTWAHVDYPAIDYQDIVYYSAPKQSKKKASLDEVDPELLDTFEKLGISLSEQKRLANVAVDAIFDSVSVATTFKKDLAKVGVIFCSISEAMHEYPELIKKYAPTKSIFGVCLGHQAIGESFGCQLLNMPDVYHGVAHKIHVVKPEVLFKDIPTNFMACRYHSWTVLYPPKNSDIEVTAEDDLGNVMALRHKNFDVRGVQFHPESILTENGKAMVQNWLEN